MSIAAYKKTIQETETPRQIERRIFTRITSALEAFRGVRGPTPEMKEALWENQRFWMALKADLVLPSNGLPKDLRLQLIGLGMWVDKHTTAILRGEETVDDLIAVNRSMIAGLSGRTDPVDGNPEGGAYAAQA